MPRKPRGNIAGVINHVIIQGTEKKYIFNDKEYILKFKEILKNKLKKSDIKILAYCIMHNHAHLLIYSEELDSLSTYMHMVNTSYAKFYNEIFKRVGHVYRDRYYSQLINDSTQLYNCIKYIHNNPVKAGICRHMSDYKYSSFNEFKDIDNKNNLVSKESLKIIFNENNYLKEFEKINNLESKEIFYDIKEKEIDDFIRDVENQYKKNILEIITDKNLYLTVIKNARIETNVTIKQLSEILHISTTTLWRDLR